MSHALERAGRPSRPALAPGRVRARIGVDFHTFEGLYQGSRSRLLGLFGELLRRTSDEFDFVLFTRAPEALRTALPACDPARVRFEPLRSRSAVQRLLGELPRLARRFELDLFDAQYILPIGLACLRVVTVHDLLFESHPQFFTRAFVLRSRLLVRRSAQRADHVVTVSHHSAGELRRRYGLAEERVTVSHDAVDPARFHPGALDPARLARRGLGAAGYVLSVGRIDRRKNLAALIEAHAGLGASAPPLVVVGQVADARAAGELRAHCARAPGRLLHLTDADDDELPGLYAGAAAFAFPSLAEGFGMPVLEAMACGVPMIASDRTALPEVAGDAARLVDPESVPELRRALAEVLTERDLRARLIERGSERARGFRWQKEAETLRALYARLLARAAR